jgi:hypothetical protein
MDFRELISSNSSSIISNMNFTGYPNEQIQAFNEVFRLLMNPLQILNRDFYNPYISEEEIKEEESYLENIDIAKIHYINLTNNEEEFEPDEKYLKSIHHLWYNDVNGNLPTIDEVTNYLFNNKCHCMYIYEDERCKSLIRHFFIIGIDHNCNEVRIAMEFYVLNNNFPSLDEIESTSERMQEFYRNPEAFHQEDKVLIGVSGLDKLQILNMDRTEFKNDDNVVCSICQEDIIEGQKYIQLNCKHMFHYSNKDCLEGASIINWLERNKYCPNCKNEVKL